MNRNNLDQHACQMLFDLDVKAFSQRLLAYRCGDALTKVPSVIHVDDLKKEALPFSDFQFHLALSTYPFFNSQESMPCILTQLKELIRVAREVRLAPHQLHDAEIEAKLGPLMLAFQQEEVGVEITPIAQEQGLKNAVMLRLWAQACRVP